MPINRLRAKIKHHFEEVLRLKTSPHQIALGFGIGTFISVLPTPGFNILIGVLFTLIYERISKLSLFGSMAIWNPLVLAPIYFLSYRIGDLLFTSEPVVKYNIVLMDQIYNFSRRFLIGNILLAAVLSILSYYIVSELVKSYYKKVEKEER